MNLFTRTLLLFVAVFSFKVQAQNIDITTELSKIEGLRFTQIASANPAYKIFEMFYRQPVNHKNPDGPSFEQKLILWHRDEVRPMVLQTSGYAIFSVGLSALASEFTANQIQVEHRFFQTSIPVNPDWSYLNIEESAGDFHRITVALKSIYKAKWVNTGRSKGGMTSMYHRYFYPNDLDATVAHVAPHSYSTDDMRYADFVSNAIGGEQNAECRAKLVASQRVLLANTADIATRIGEGTFNLLGSKEIAIEHALLEMPWSFWQYSGPGESCANVPAESAPIDEHLSFLFANNDPNGYNDEGLSGFVPYYYQAATQLGSPGTTLSNLADLLKFADTFNIFTYIPKDIPATYDNAKAMHQVSDWIKHSSEKILYVYGDWDPWSGGAYEPRIDGDSYRFYVPKTNHSAQFINLSGEARDLAYMKLSRWLNVDRPVETQSPPNARKAKTLEDIEFEALRKLRVR